jgi:D-lactate dehydrogenase
LIGDMALTSAFVDRLREIFPHDALTVDAAECLAYGYDNSRRQAQPDAVVFPTSHEHVVALVNACRAERVPMTARGCGTNTTGATVPTHGGIVVSFERMNRIVRIDTDNRYAVVEPGVLNGSRSVDSSGHPTQRRVHIARSAAISRATRRDRAR